MRREKQMEKIKNAENLNELCEILNELDESEGVDFSNLPTFGGKEISDTAEVWSWDETDILIYDGTWHIEPRCDCGEAAFNCNCDENDVIGCLGYKGARKSLKDMESAIEKGAKSLANEEMVDLSDVAD